MSDSFEFERRVTEAMQAGVVLGKRDWARQAVGAREKISHLLIENADMDGRLTAIEAQNELYEEQVGKLKMEIEKSEDELANTRDTIENIMGPSRCYYITYEQISTAVESANQDRLHQDGGGWLALNKLHIYRCDDCNGRGYLDQEPVTSGAYPNQQPQCPACNGCGYVIAHDDGPSGRGPDVGTIGGGDE